MSIGSTTPKADLDFIRKQFPFFTSASKDWAFFENAGGTLPCGPVVDRLTHFYRENKVQPYPHNALANAAQEQMDAGRTKIAELLGSPYQPLPSAPRPPKTSIR
jgi:selenocysteine lyase/cysteine desulfurase